MDILLGQLFTGLSIGSVLLLVALGLAIIYGTMGVINLAHGEFVMLGAYATWFLQSTLGLTLLPCLLVVFLMVAAAGWAVERTIVRFLYRRPLDTILATWGIGIMLQQAVRLAAGADLRYVQTPDQLAGSIDLAGVAIPSYRLFILAFSAALLGLTWFVVQRTEFGMKLRAVTQNREMASCYGIDSARIFTLTFAFGSGLAGLAGALIAPIKSVAPDMGTNFVVDAFMVVVVGGVGSLFGTVASAGLIGGGTAGFAFLLNDTLAKALVFLGVVVLVRFRPQGLFAATGRR
ncbi:urea transport system permease protein [Azospirillum lipoferum]|uniref:Urea ABC transporter permease subunit UrtB n=1 Tax=Azospirillum lipoferum TaxID=193 RepID=A0A5A9GQA7_AZOLI|nr:MULTISPECIES: urea ABC transporter permease subunit UrtB [Azospirillum]KAA0595962.1 urea ABC transporter permease subunit UrtB [Azospirillum lipoferum]MCP1610859.1 urea transport system permease protein [Azospirillum lipoferum]MDW5533993.1 urea ABC transporter permease subunit UrtB [Azospirillum sp. NL1]